MKRTINLILIISIMLSFAACGCSHDYAPATCTEPEICKKCGETNGEPLGHTWIEANCTDAKTCEKCGETEGEALGHKWLDATLTEPETCSVCGETRGEKLSEEEYYSNMLIGSWRGIKLDGETQSAAKFVKVNFDEDYKGTFIVGNESFNIEAVYDSCNDFWAYFLLYVSGFGAPSGMVGGGIVVDQSNILYNTFYIAIDDYVVTFEKE